MGASHGIGYVLGAAFGVPHGYTSCVMLPSVMRWNKTGQCRAAGAGCRRPWGIRARTPPTCSTISSAASACRAACRRSASGPSISTASPSRRWRPLGAAQSAQDRRAPRRCAKSSTGRIRRPETRCTPASMLIFVRCSPPSSWRGSGEAVTYRELEARSNRLAHLFRNRGLKRLDHYAIFMENNSRYLEACGAGERSGLYYTCVNSYLTPGELAYILTNSQSRILITSMAKLDIAREALKECPKVELCIVADGAGESDRIVGLQEVDRRAAEDADRRRKHRHRDALFVGHHRPAEGHLAAAAGAAADAAIAAVRFPAKALAIPRRHDLSVARAALSFGAAGRRQSRRSGWAAPRSSWKVSIPSVISSWSRNGASPTPSWCRRCSRAC